MFKRNVMTCAALATLLGSFLGVPTAHAGTKYPSPVSVVPRDSSTGSTATGYGSMGAARNSADTNSLIGCWAEVYGTSYFGWCQARDANGINVTCTTTTQSFAEMMMSVKPDSYIYFSADPYGYCTIVEVGTSSSYQPKNP